MSNSNQPEQRDQGSQPTRLERVSSPWLFRLARVPRWLFMVVLAAVLLAGLALENALGGVLLLLLALFLAWLAAIGWRYVSPAGRVLRLAVLVPLVVVGVSYFR